MVERIRLHKLETQIENEKRQNTAQTFEAVHSRFSIRVPWIIQHLQDISPAVRPGVPAWKMGTSCRTCVTIYPHESIVFYYRKTI